MRSSEELETQYLLIICNDVAVKVYRAFAWSVMPTYKSQLMRIELRDGTVIKVMRMLKAFTACFFP